MRVLKWTEWMSPLVHLEVTFAETSTTKTQRYEKNALCSDAPAWFEHDGNVLYVDLQCESSEKCIRGPNDWKYKDPSHYGQNTHLLLRRRGGEEVYGDVLLQL